MSESEFFKGDYGTFNVSNPTSRWPTRYGWDLTPLDEVEASQDDGSGASRIEEAGDLVDRSR